MRGRRHSASSSPPSPAPPPPATAISGGWLAGERRPSVIWGGGSLSRSVCAQSLRACVRVCVRGLRERKRRRERPSVRGSEGEIKLTPSWLSGGSSNGRSCARRRPELEEQSGAEPLAVRQNRREGSARARAYTHTN